MVGEKKKKNISWRLLHFLVWLEKATGMAAEHRAGSLSFPPSIPHVYLPSFSLHPDELLALSLPSFVREWQELRVRPWKPDRTFRETHVQPGVSWLFSLSVILWKPFCDTLGHACLTSAQGVRVTSLWG